MAVQHRRTAGAAAGVAATGPGWAEPGVFRAGHLEVGPGGADLCGAGPEVRLKEEYQLLRLSCCIRARCSHRQLLREVWGPHSLDQTHYLRVYPTHLREKLERDPARPELFLTEPGVGYRPLFRRG